MSIEAIRLLVKQSDTEQYLSGPCQHLYLAEAKGEPRWG